KGAGQHVVEGSQAWVTVLCKFPDLGDFTQDLNYFQNMYSDDYPGFGHYWREQSFNKVNLLGSESFGTYTLPHDQTFYYPNPGQGQDPGVLDGLGLDCVAQADADIDFTAYVGINFMFNGLLDCCAWGGSTVWTIDGETREWRITFNPDWSWTDITVVAHEIGHGFGLPHANNYDNDTNPYDTPWDVMSDTYFFCNLSIDPIYGCLGQHTNAGYKDFLGWFDADRRLVVEHGATGPVTLDHAQLPGSANYQVILVPLDQTGNFYYAIEARQTTNSGYDKKLPGKAVVIWEMDLDGSRDEWAWQVGATTDAKSRSVSDGPDGAWLPGETFTENNVSISVLESTTDGFVVSVTRDDAQILVNGGMETDANTDKVPDSWKAKNLTKDKVKCDTETKVVANSGVCAFMFKGGVGESSGLSQVAPVIPDFAATDSLDVSLYINGSSAAINGKVKMVVAYTDTGLERDKVLLPFAVTSGYEELPGSVSLKSGDVSKIKFLIQNKSTAGKFYVDDVSVLWSQAPALLPLPGVK
ncbi:MAG TPA: hypothetical protein VHL11_07465, partial [Phototrophicaceae bacterium]|nr:hypothetical protein [Phototrophicaceae bacterium]